MTTRRTVRHISLIVETTDLSPAEHDKRVFWAENNVINANNRKEGDGYFVAVVVSGGENGGTRFAGSGQPTEETTQLIRELEKGNTT